MFFETYLSLKLLGERCKKNPRKVTASEFTSMIRRQFPAADFSFVTERSTLADPDMVVVSGTYDSDSDDEMLPAIEIILHYRPDQKFYYTHLFDWDHLAFDLAECAYHEMIHRDQYRDGIELAEYRSTTDNFLLVEDQEYLGWEGEIEAYGFSIAAEAAIRGLEFDQCTMTKVYKETFDNDPKVLLKLEQQFIKYLERLGAA